MGGGPVVNPIEKRRTVHNDGKLGVVFSASKEKGGA